ncbi:hypothetical protein E2C01_074360 [Portunus trituberculatus]|uniref:Uncharacterized protein n=1 Tax=Portunus trituberculatus TaxID=210409 RepID=A0A5B7IGV9_PORTR|nr:hypothetical protein [Portunus trituberculatus]
MTLFYLQQAGLIEKWGSDVMDEIRSDSRKKQRKEKSDGVKKVEGIVKPLTIVHMQGPLFLFLIFIIVSFGAFLTEMSVGVWHQRTRKE